VSAASRDQLLPPSVDATTTVGEGGEPGSGESLAESAAYTRAGSASSTAIACTVTARPLPG
jgi:hypothetical protein